MSAVTEPKELVLLGKAARALSQANSLDEVLEIRDQAAAAKHYCRVAKLGVETYNLAAEVKLRAERRAGQFLESAQKRNGARDGKTGLHDATPMLADYGVEKTQAHRWQRIASVDESDFEAHIESSKAAGLELTTASVLRLAKRQEQSEAIAVHSAAATEHGVVSDLSQLIAAGAKFGTIYADPPWSYDNGGTRSNVASEYKATMSIDEICAEPVSEIVTERGHLHLWTTNAFMFEARKVMEAWGFEYKSCFVWVKPNIGIGNYWRVSHEFMLLGVRGGLTFADRSQRSWIEQKRTKHSQKPHCIRNIIEKVSPGPYLEMYGRHHVEGWTVYGNEIIGHAQREFTIQSDLF